MLGEDVFVVDESQTQEDVDSSTRKRTGSSEKVGSYSIEPSGAPEDEDDEDGI